MIDTSNREIQSHYDLIVVGAGAAGSVLAAELSASHAKVLMNESGGPDDGPTITNPSIWFLHGILGLRVADASVMPQIITGPGTNAASYMIGGRAAKLIL